MPNQLDPRASRRNFLQGLTALALPAAAAAIALPALPAEAALPVREISLRHRHTGEQVRRMVYYENGRYVPETMREISHVLRDWRNGQVKAYDPRLLDLLFALQKKLGTREPFDIICGYRSPQTNAMLRRTTRGVARNSLHLKAMAIDLAMPGRSLRAVRDAARQLKMGGVGYYASSGFVHVDTGSIRYW